MTTTGMPTYRRPLSSVRRAAFVLLTAVGVVLSPLPAQASASGGGGSSPPVTVAPAAAPTRAAQTAVDTALDQQGDPYVWGGDGPDSFDCSGLTQYAYAAADISLPHSSNMQSRSGTPVAYSDLRPGDLVFFYHPVSHVGMYIGNGQMVHAGSSGDVVKVVRLSNMPDFNSARRIA
jgi:cell wall-associated NlpC family hydrolase